MNKKLRFYVEREELNDYEKKNNRISFKRLFNRLFTDAIMCNDINKLFYADINGEYNEAEIEIGLDYDEENDNYIDIYQYFIVDFNNYTYSKMKELKKELGKEFILYYLSNLDLYVVGITHFGTGWDYVLTDIIPTQDLQKADL